jgi:aarF domain-containing kinase
VVTSSPALMAGRRLVDAAKLFNASKSIAHQHVKLRSQQLDALSKTSTLAKAAKSQTDRVTLTVEAALALSKRLNEEVPRYASAAAQRATGAQNADIPRTEAVRTERRQENRTEGLRNDHRYDHAGSNTRAEPSAEGELNVQQETFARRPLPDGTIPSASMSLEDETKGQDTFSKRTVPAPPKEPLAQEQTRRHQDEGLRPLESEASTIPTPDQPSGLATDALQSSSRSSEEIPEHANKPYRPTPTKQVQELQQGHDRDVFYTRSVEAEPISSSPRTQIPSHTEDRQESDAHVQDSQLNQDVYYSVSQPTGGIARTEGLPSEHAVPKPDEVPEGINTDVFRTQRVAKMLGGNPYKQQHRVDSQGVAKAPRIQDTFDVRGDEQSKPSASEAAPETTPLTTTEKEMQDLASELAKDAQTSSEVSFVRTISTMRHADILTVDI